MLHFVKEQQQQAQLRCTALIKEGLNIFGKPITVEVDQELYSYQWKGSDDTCCRDRIDLQFELATCRTYDSLLLHRS